MKMREEEKNQSSQVKKFFKKRWVFPAVYLVSAALLISMIVWYQTGGLNIAKGPEVADPGKELIGNKNDEPSIEVNQSFENFAMPVQNQDEVEVVTQFFDSAASAEDQEKALIVDGDMYRPNMGLDIAHKEGKEFKVVSALSGKVAAVRQDNLLGNVIEIEHDKGIMTVYQAVKDIQVEAGDMVKQGEVLATSSTSQLNKAAENHVHFEIRKESKAVNPLSFFGQPVTALEQVDADNTTSTTPEEDESDSVSEDDKSESVSEDDKSESVSEDDKSENVSEDNKSESVSEDENADGATDAETTDEETTDSADNEPTTN
ncbi:M23 family metallopeptidase [Lederbergia lenta]|nr:M23 family metallopeptidase [Lederbergia lenta]MEC2323213.1 peptidoglycan DD-metalloendopeptidase family protein [Lederbergia lenta]